MVSTAFLVSLYISLSYVGAVYATTARAGDYRSGRDNPQVIRQRMGRICSVMALNLVVIPMLLWHLGHLGSFQEAFLTLGLYPNHSSFFFQPIKALLLISMLYVGPLVDALLYYVFVPSGSLSREFKEELLNIWGLRNYVFAPFSEEVFYTSMILNSYLTLPHEPASNKQLICLTPLFFGLAHLHHAYESYYDSQSSMAAVCLTAAVQAIYTTVFGSFTNCVFLKTGGNLWACVLLHAFCNYMGFPEPSRLYTYYSDVRKPPTPIAAKLLSWWNKCYFCLLLGGIWLFKCNFNPLLNSPYSLI
ncbi:related to CAAX prenyl protease 2 [Zygosaccharomyces bailii]|nr:related to CAAX prenyl protease 2 [Zygosaccharomyces bailii]